MLLHCTEKLGARLKALPNAGDATAESPLGPWHANLIRIDRAQCVLFCHDETRFCLFLPSVKAPQFAELGRLHRELFAAALAAQGVPDSNIKRALLALGPLQIDRATDRSVLGTINIATGDLEAFLFGIYDSLAQADPVALSQRLNKRPVRARRNLLWPDEMMARQVSQLAGRPASQGR